MNEKYDIINKIENNKRIEQLQNMIIEKVPRIRSEIFLKRILITLDDYIKENPE